MIRPYEAGDLHGLIRVWRAASELAHPFLTEAWAARLVRAYGTDAQAVLASAGSAADLGEDFGETLTEREVRWLIEREFARSAEDVLWRRSKLGLRFGKSQAERLDAWIKEPVRKGWEYDV